MGVHHPHLTAPYSNSDIPETYRHREILNIYRLASSDTRPYYDCGRDIELLEEENWVIRWLLWHVFRYRDDRNRNRRQASPSRSSSEDQNMDVSNGSQVRPSRRSQCSYSQPPDPMLINRLESKASQYYDPIRDRQRSPS